MARMRSAVDFEGCALKNGKPVSRQKNLARKQLPWASGRRGADQSKSHSTHGASLRGVPMWVVVMRVRRMGRLVAAARSALQAVAPSMVGLLPMSRPWRCSVASCSWESEVMPRRRAAVAGSVMRPNVVVR